MNAIYSGKDIQAHIKQHGSYMTLKGNIAPFGITVDLNTVPDDMIGMRGVVRLFATMDELVKAFSIDSIHDGDAIFILGAVAVKEKDIFAVEEAAKKSGWKHLALILSCRPERQINGFANFWYDSPEDAGKNYATALKDGDRMEYDVTAELFGVDLIECLDHRLSDRSSEPFYYEQLDNDIWVIGEEFTRMFLVLGEKRALLIDAGFGYGDMAAAVRNITDLPYDVALTHGHFDHAGGIRFFDDTDCKVYLHPADYPCVEVRQGTEILKRLTPLEDGFTFDLGGRRIRTMWLPGHSKGSVVFIEDATGTLFAGDSLLRGPFFLLGGKQDVDVLRSGLTQLLNIDPAIKIFYPAHREKFPMTREDVKEIIHLLDDILSSTAKGAPTWIAPIDKSPYKTYRRGIFSVYTE